MVFCHCFRPCILIRQHNLSNKKNTKSFKFPGHIRSKYVVYFGATSDAGLPGHPADVGITVEASQHDRRDKLCATDLAVAEPVPEINLGTKLPVAKSFPLS